MFELTDQAFTGVQPLLPANCRRGKPWRDHRQVLDGSGGSCTPADRGGKCPSGSGPGRPAMAGCAAGSGMGPGPGSGRCWPAASRAQATVEVASSARRCWRRRRGSGGRGLMAAPHHDHHSTWRTVVASTTPGRPAADAPPRWRPGPGPTLEVVAVLRAQPPPRPPDRRGGVDADRRQERLGRAAPGSRAGPRRQTADLVVVQADLVLGGLEACLDRPAHPRDADQFASDVRAGRSRRRTPAPRPKPSTHQHQNPRPGQPGRTSATLAQS
jgi:hypothetical protein